MIIMMIIIIYGLGTNNVCTSDSLATHGAIQICFD